MISEQLSGKSFYTLMVLLKHKSPCFCFHSGGGGVNTAAAAAGAAEQDNRTWRRGRSSAPQRPKATWQRVSGAAKSPEPRMRSRTSSSSLQEFNISILVAMRKRSSLAVYQCSRSSGRLAAIHRYSSSSSSSRSSNSSSGRRVFVSKIYSRNRSMTRRVIKIRTKIKP